MRVSRRALALAALCSIAACGGGGNEDGPPDQVTLSVAAISVSGAAGQCAVGYGGTVHVFGGQPPYQLYNSVPNAVQLNTSKVGDAGGGFDVNFLGACFSDMPITVKDDMGRLATLTLTNLPGT